MATSRKTPAPKKPAVKARPGSRSGTPRAKDNPKSTSGLAKRRSQIVADQIAAGKRNFLEDDEHLELPKDATPLDVMLMAMRRAYLLGGSIFAAPYAEKAAPYIHGKISTIELKNTQAPAAGGEASGGPIPFQVAFVDPKKE